MRVCFRQQDVSTRPEITLALSEKTRETAIEMIKRFKQAGA